MPKLVAENSIQRIDIKNIDNLNSISVDRKFGRPEDFIEVHIYNLNNELLSSIDNYTDYNAGENKSGLIDEIKIDSKKILNEGGFISGKFKLHVNIQKRKIFNFTTPVFFVNEISSTRTELKLSTTEGNTVLDSNSRNFIQAVNNSTYLRDFNLNFGRDLNIIGVNIDIDRSNPNQFLLLIKLLKPLPDNLEVGDRLTIVEDIVEPLEIIYDLGVPEPIDTTIPVKGPNFKINTRLNPKVPAAYKSYNDILSTSLTSSYQKLISKLDGIEVPEIDYSYIKPVDTASLDFLTVTPTHFENFVHFGSATELLNNFKYKLELIETYDKQLADVNIIPGNTSHSLAITNASSSILAKKEDLIQGFSGYEQFLYFESGTYSWPKTNISEPYVLAHVTSSAAETWLGSANSRNPNYGGQLLSASIFDKQNPNRLSKLVPTFIGDKDDNLPYLLFCDMIGQGFDPIWTHIKELTQIRDNSHTLGVSKNLVYYALQTLGIDAFDQFENDDLIGYIFGENYDPQDTSTVITASNDIVSKETISKEIWKRLYHNAPYLLKTKGTERGLRALVNCYGIPETAIDIKEFGSSDPNRDEFKLYTYPKFSQVITGNSLTDNVRGMFLQTNWSSSTSDNLIADISESGKTSLPKTVEFRLKPIRGKSGSVEYDDQYHLFSLTNHTGSGHISSSDLHLVLHPYTGSKDFFITGDKSKYGKLELIQYTSSIASSSGLPLSGSSSPYFPIYNGEFWNIFLATEGLSGSSTTCSFGAYQSNHLREVLHYTSSTILTEEDNAKSFGSPFYLGGQYIGGVNKGFFGGILDITSNGIVTQSFYTNSNTSSFELGFNGSLSEVRYYFGELLSHDTLKKHALEPLMIGGNSISSSFDVMTVRYPLSFELDLDLAVTSPIPSASALWNSDPTTTGLTSPASNLIGPITGGAILSSSLLFAQTSSGEALSGSNNLGASSNIPLGAESAPVSYSGQFFPSGSVPLGNDNTVYTVGGVPLLQSSTPSGIDYLSGFTYFGQEFVELVVEDHHLPTPNTIGKSPVNKKVRVDSGSTDDNILSPDVLSQLPSTERQVPDFSNIGIYLSPQFELTEDIIYTLGTFSLDEFLGDPREGTKDFYSAFNELKHIYFKKLAKGKDKYNIRDYTRWVQYLDHTLFEVIKNFTPQKSIDKTGLLIEPHVLERSKFKRNNPILTEGGVRGTTTLPKLSSSLYDTTIQEITQSFHKNNNISSLDGTSGSAVISYTAITSSKVSPDNTHTKYNFTIDVAKALSGSSNWEQGPIIPNSTGSSVKQRNSSGSNVLSPTLTPYGNYLNSSLSKNKFSRPLSGSTLGTSRNIEFDDSLIEMETWRRSRYNGSKLIGTKINEYTEGDITYGLKPVLSQKSTALYFGKTIIGADGENDSLVTIKNHSYISIEKIMIIDKYGDTITTINVDNENFDSINSYIAKDFKNGDKFSLKIMDNGISSQLKQLYTSKFNQGYLYKVLEHKGINGSGNIHGEGIQVGYVDSAPSDFPYTSSIDPSVQTPSNVFCYGNDANTVNSDTIILKSNTLTKKIWPIESTFGHIDFVTSSNTNYPYTSMQNLSTFINSMLIPIASESQYRLFGTFNLGQPILPANYDLTQNLGIKSISTVEFDIASGSYFVTSSLHDQISGSSDMLGFGKPLIRPDHAVIPIMQGPNDIITDKKLNANVTWPGNGGDTGGTHSGATDIQLQFYFSGNAEQHALYQISYLEEKQVIIADIDKPSELTNDIGEKGYILIPDNLDKDIKDNLDYFLNRAGFEDDEPERIPNAKE